MTEQELQQLCGKENPFRVPEGYFEAFNEQMMAKIAATATSTKSVRLHDNSKKKVVWLRPLLATAACICVAIFALALIFNQKVEQKEDGSVVLRFKSNQRQQIFSWVLGFGTAVTVVNPSTLKEELKAEIKKLAEKY